MIRHFLFSCKYAFGLWIALLKMDGKTLDAYAWSLYSKSGEIHSPNEVKHK